MLSHSLRGNAAEDKGEPRGVEKHFFLVFSPSFFHTFFSTVMTASGTREMDARLHANAVTRRSLPEYQTVNNRAIAIGVLINEAAIRERSKSWYARSTCSGKPFSRSSPRIYERVSKMLFGAIHADLRDALIRCDGNCENDSVIPLV